MPSPAQVGRTLRRWREERGLPISDMATYVKHEIGPGHSASWETLRRYEIGRMPVESMDPIVIVGWAKVCDANLAEVGEPIVGTVEKAKRLLMEMSPRVPKSGSRCKDGEPGQVTPLHSPAA